MGVLEKAESQHHLLPMYCQLCADLDKWFVERKIAKTREQSFRQVLLNRCRKKFEVNLVPFDRSAVSKDVDPEEAAIKHKEFMLGNIKFIAALLEQKMLQDRVLVQVAEQLLVASASAVHTLESLACFLTAVGPTFDQPNFRHFEHLKLIFIQIEAKSKDKSIAAR